MNNERLLEPTWLIGALDALFLAPTTLLPDEWSYFFLVGTC